VTRTARAHVAFHCSSYLCFVVETVVGGYTMTNTPISLFDAIHSQRAIRHFSAQPVSDEAIETLLHAAICAPSGGNRQPWRFLVMREAALKRQRGQWYLAAWQTATAGMEVMSQPYRHGAELAQQMATVPVLILACIDHGDAGPGLGPITRGASIYPRCPESSPGRPRARARHGVDHAAYAVRTRDQGATAHPRHRRDCSPDSGRVPRGGRAIWTCPPEVVVGGGLSRPVGLEHATRGCVGGHSWPGIALIVHHGDPCRHGDYAHKCPKTPRIFAMPAAHGSASLPEERSCDRFGVPSLRQAQAPACENNDAPNHGQCFSAAVPNGKRPPSFLSLLKSVRTLGFFFEASR
jgi:hypothetical protein